MNYTRAKKIADRIVELVGMYTDKIDIAGSVRRRKAECGDIEIVCMPKKEFVATDLFGGGKNVVHPNFEKALYAISEKVLEGNVHGRMMKIILSDLYGSMQLDLFMPQPHDYYRILAIRTGSAEYSHKVLATAWLKKGWVGTSYGLRRESDCEKKGAGPWVLKYFNGLLPPAWQSEEEFFSWLDLPLLDPAKREVKKAFNAYQ